MKGESLIGLGQPSLAMVELQRAITLKPDYWPPYVAISDYYKDAGEFGKAREWLEKGLRFASTKALKNRIAGSMRGRVNASPCRSPLANRLNRPPQSLYKKRPPTGAETGSAGRA
jgi:hypothetical protein